MPGLIPAGSGIHQDYLAGRLSPADVQAITSSGWVFPPSPFQGVAPGVVAPTPSPALTPPPPPPSPSPLPLPPNDAGQYPDSAGRYPDNPFYGNPDPYAGTGPLSPGFRPPTLPPPSGGVPTVGFPPSAGLPPIVPPQPPRMPAQQGPIIQRDQRAPVGWPDGVPYKTVRRTQKKTLTNNDGTLFLNASGQPVIVDVPDEEEPDWSFAFDYMQAVGLGAYKRPQAGPSVDQQIADALAKGDYPKVRELLDAVQQLATDAQKKTQDLADERQRLENELARQTDPIRIKQIQRQYDLAIVAEERATEVYNATKARQAVEDELAKTTQPARIALLQQQLDSAKADEQRAVAREKREAALFVVQMSNLSLQNELQRETNPARIQQLQDEVQRAISAEDRARRAFDLSEQRETLENAFIKETDPTRRQLLEQQLTQAKSEETRAQQAFDIDLRRRGLDLSLAEQTNPILVQQTQQRLDQARAEETRVSGAFALEQKVRELERALMAETNPLRVGALRQQVEQAKAAENRAQRGFELERDLAQASGRRAEEAFGPEQARLQGRFDLERELARSGEARATQGQAFQQGLQTLGAGLDILRSPGDYYLYQKLLRGQQAPQQYTGQQVVPRNPFLGPFGEQLLGGQPQTLASQSPFAGLGEALSGQQVSRPRQLPSIGAPPFLGLQQYRNLLPSEREMRQAEIQSLGIPLQDYEEQERRLFPRATVSSPFTRNISSPMRGL